MYEAADAARDAGCKYVTSLFSFLHVNSIRPDASPTVVVVVVAFFDHNFVHCKAALILEIKNLRNKIQYKPK